MNIKSTSLFLFLLITNPMLIKSMEPKTTPAMAVGSKTLSASARKQYQLSLKEQNLRFAQSISKRYKPDASSCFSIPPVTYLCISNKKEFLVNLQQRDQKP